MSFLLDQFSSLSERTIKTLNRYPMASFSAFIVTIVLINLVELQGNYQDNPIAITLIKIAFVASLGVVMFPALRLLRTHWLMIVLGIGLLAGYYYILPSDITASESNIFVRHFFLMVAFFIMLIWAPFALLSISNRNIWEWTQNLIVALVSSIFFSLILFGGLSLALFSVSRLFEIEIASERYIQVAIAVFGFYGINIFLSQVPKYVLLLQTKVYSKAEIIFTKYILTPLTLGYFLILYLYTAKVLITMSWPKGILAWIIVIFSFVAILTYLFWTPLKKNHRFNRYIWIAILIQTLMLGLAIGIRVEEYGITESRYFMALYGIWLLMMSLYFILVKNVHYKWLFLTVSLLLISSQFGTYSAAEVSKRSQQDRLQHYLSNLQPMSEQSDLKSRYEISEIIQYLYNYYGIEALQAVIPTTVAAYELWNEDENGTDQRYDESYFPYFAAEHLGFKFVTNWEYENRDFSNVQTFTSDEQDEMIAVAGYQWMTHFYYNQSFDHEEATVSAQDDGYHLALEANQLKVTEHNQTTAIDLSHFITSLPLQYDQVKFGTQSVKAEDLYHHYQDEQLKVKLLINSISIQEDNNISMLDCNVLIGKLH